MKTIIIGLAAATLLATPAFASGNNNGNGNGPQGGNATAAAIQGQAQGQIQGQHQSSYNKNTNTNANLNANQNRNRNTATGGAGGSANSNARGGDQSQGQQTNVDNSGAGSNSNNYQQSGIPVSSAVAPSFAIGGCQWAVSGGIQFFGTGVSGGGAGMYEFCKGLMKAKHFREVGAADVATALECQDSSIRAAYKEAGRPCAADLPRVAANGAGIPVTAAPVVPVVVGSAPQCFDAAGRSVPVGQPGAVRCQ